MNEIIQVTTDPRGYKSIQYQDGRGNITSVRRFDEDGVTVKVRADYAYNGLGELLRVLDTRGNPLTVEYDQAGRRTALESADTGRKTYGYDKAGNLTEETDSVLRERGERIRYRYDGFNRLALIDYPDSIDTGGGPGVCGSGAGVPEAFRL